jgi:hypothetical protein
METLHTLDFNDKSDDDGTNLDVLAVNIQEKITSDSKLRNTPAVQRNNYCSINTVINQNGNHLLRASGNRLEPQDSRAVLKKQ